MNKLTKLILLLGITSTNLIVFASAITIGYSTGESGESISSSFTYDLDDSTSLVESTTLNGASIFQDQKSRGSGKNTIAQLVAGKGYSTTRSLANSGSFNAQSSVAATGNEAGYSQTFDGTGTSAISQKMTGNGYAAESSASGFGFLSTSTSSVASLVGSSLNQQLTGIGDSDLCVGGNLGADISEQRASMTDGLIASSQSLSTGDGVSASQTSKLSGEAGNVESSTISASNVVLESGSFKGQGVLDAGMKSIATSSAKTTAKVSLDGDTWIDDDVIKGVSSGNQMMNVDGIRLTSPTDLGTFQMSVANMDRQNFDQVAVVPQGAGAEAGSGAGSASSYRLGGARSDGALYRWNEMDPNIKLWLRDDDNLKGTNLPKQDIANSIAIAANTWDDAVNRNLFLDGTTVELDPNVKANTRDTKNVHAFVPFGDAMSGYAALTYTYSDIPVKYGFYSISESDVIYNSELSWSTTQLPGTNDVQSTALHELGHTIGLGDLYYDADNPNSLPQNDPRTKDTAQVMNTQQLSLGSGDLQGVRLLYDYTPVALRSNNGQYVCAEGGGGQDLEANRDWIGDWETFELVDLGDNNVALRANNGKYVCAELGSSKKLVANRINPQAWETFKISDLGFVDPYVRDIALQANNGKWVCAENGGGRELVANRDAQNAWESFKLIEMGENDQRWQAKDLHYVCAELGGGNVLSANRDNWGPWENFDGIMLPNNGFALRTINGQYICAEGGGGGLVDATRSWIGPWETFTWEYLGSDSFGNLYSLRSSNGQYLQADPEKGGMIWANSNDQTGWATFYMY